MGHNNCAVREFFRKLANFKEFCSRNILLIYMYQSAVASYSTFHPLLEEQLIASNKIVYATKLILSCMPVKMKLDTETYASILSNGQVKMLRLYLNGLSGRMPIRK